MAEGSLAFADAMMPKNPNNPATPVEDQIDEELREIAAKVTTVDAQAEAAVPATARDGDSSLPLDDLQPEAVDSADRQDGPDQDSGSSGAASAPSESAAAAPLRVSDLAQPPPGTFTREDLSVQADPAVLKKAAAAGPRFAAGLTAAQKQAGILEAVTNETAALKDEIIALVKGSYADLSLDSKIADVVASITDMLDQSALLMSKFVVVFQAQQASLQEVFGSLTTLASEVRASPERAQLDEQKNKMLTQLAQQRDVLRGYGERLKGFVSARDQEAFQAALRTIESIPR